ncbi:adenylate cyclase [Enhydrobacter aerosaccus]|uniref:Adenylate cyclase n=1 Tax=Enhydrobacter aerosaccus TaxID=225324 RepID=A0A1T4T1Y5_9HYPH|nr:adenylate/guanylate cyclase domain-containing protein [Enhydrobacter aerosaccus]SKA34241.1 adenylate cyclase [Enhydrobacter aerosaccus]
MISFFKRDWRLKPSILALFVVLTVPVSVTIVAVTFLSNESIARIDAETLVDRFRVTSTKDAESDFDGIKAMARTAAVLGSEQPDFYFNDRSLGYLDSILLSNDKIVSAYVGLNDGTFRQARRIDPQVKIQGKLPPAGARFAYRWIVKGNDGILLDRYEFRNAEGVVLGTSQEETSYDPRQRVWYRFTVQAGSTFTTEPDVFAALGLIGFTIAAPFSADGRTLGVAAIDMTLDGLSAYLAERKISAGTRSYILDSRGLVIANSDMSKTYTNNDGQVELRHLTEVGGELVAAAFTERPEGREKLYTFFHDGDEYVASLTALPPAFGKRWQLFVLTPLSDFTRPFEKNNHRMLLFGLVATALQLVIIYLLSGIVSAPLERLARKVDRIQEFEGESLPSPQSAIREISVLSRAIDTLDSAAKAFAAFVPVGLVKQLLQSDQKLELGGHSRFLTIFFSDLEAFSTLSEEVPSQELLLRISAYFALVTRIVNAEHGTIDKFLGDGVMAFWGAPALLEDHAWLACVAALRIQRGMEELNTQWREQGLKPLNLRIGIHSDAVLVGNVGSRERMSYTVIGDGVNVAARLEGINKEYGTRVCISHSVFKEAGERLCVRPIEEVVVKGRRARIPIYELLGVYGAGPELEPDPALQRLGELSRDAYAAWSAQKPEALDLYKKILCEFPTDGLAKAFVARLGSA